MGRARGWVSYTGRALVSYWLPSLLPRFFSAMADVSPFSQSRVLRTVSLPLPSTLGRFELRQRLGQGAQSVVYRAFDPRLEREVAIKLMRADALGSEHAVAQWLHEARSASRVTHPNIVALFEADIQDHRPYLVFEYVEGQTLAQQLKTDGALSAAQAVALAMDVLDALAAAHTAGVVHRDLKPSNILVDKAGRARVMDFGIAARIVQAQGAVAAGAGTPGYLSPEAASGAAPAPSMDIFGLGLVLAEMLSGQPLVTERDPYRAVYRVMHEQLVLPEGLDVDERLRALVQRALAREPGQRFANARVFLAELEAWSKPAGAATAANAPSRGTLDFLLRRMRHKTDFPAMSEAIVRIQSMASSDTESIHSVTSEILKDVALTNKLLRLVNSAQYSRGDSISTVSRAVSLVGFNGIRNMALSLVLLEHMSDKAHAALLKEEFLRSLMAGSIGAELCATPREAEEAFIGAMFQNLGRLLVQYYFPEEAQAIRTLVQRERAAMTEAQAAMEVLGMGLDELGAGIARAWGLPRNIVRCIEKPHDEPPAQVPADTVERMRWLALAANDMADAMLHAPAEQLDATLEHITLRYSRVAGLGGKNVQQAQSAARKKLVELARAMDLSVAPKSAAARLLHAPSPAAPGAPEGADAGGRARAGAGSLGSARANARAQTNQALEELELHATRPHLDDGAGQATQGVLAVAGDAPVHLLHRPVGETLAAGIQDITNAMVEDFKLPDVLRMILETMYRALELDRILFCMRDPKTETVTGRFGLGKGVDAHVKTFRTPLKSATPDLFALVCNKGSDTLISDATEPRIAQRLPAWYRSGLNAPTFLLLPLQLKGAPFGLIYADKIHPSSLELDDKELSLLRTLRNQAVMAFKQASA